MGCKAKLAEKILSFFPLHDIYIEPFFGTGSIFFAKPLAKYNFLNDIDNDVYNLFKQLIENPRKLYSILRLLPVHETTFKEFLKTKSQDPIMQAARFLYLSNYSLLGTSSALRLANDYVKKILLQNIKNISINKLKDAKFMNCDFREILGKVGIRDRNIGHAKNRIFIYCDPPYIGTNHNYSNNWTESDLNDLIEMLINYKAKFAISEFDSEIIREKAKHYGLEINYIAERQTLKNRNTDILLTNYNIQKLF